MAHDDEKKPYRVGYANPPRHTQFKKGQSGNPTGRRKRPATTSELLAKVFREKVPITVNGVPTRVSLIEAAVRQMAGRSVSKGSPSDLIKLIELAERFGLEPVDRQREQAEADAEKVIEKILTYIDRTVPD